MPVSDGLNWGTPSATVNVGETITVNVSYGVAPTSAGITSNLNGLATAALSGNTVTFTGVAAGSVTVPTGSGVGNTCLTTNSFTLTVAAATDDESYLNKRGLTHFWNNIDTLKQDKLTAGTNITIASNNTISASQPTVGNATLTIQKNGTNVQTFTANATSNKTANITVPTKTSDLTNDSNFVADASYVHTDNNYTTTEKNKLAGIAAGAEVNVQSDWATSDTTFDSYIKNKPTIGNGKITIKKNGTQLTVFTANQTADVVADVIVPTTVAELSDASTYVTQNSLATQLANKQNTLTAGDHINITGSTIKAVDYVHSDDPVPTTAVTPVVTNNMIADGTITADKLATGATVKLTLSTSDIGEGTPLAANTLYGVYS